MQNLTYTNEPRNPRLSIAAWRLLPTGTNESGSLQRSAPSLQYLRSIPRHLLDQRRPDLAGSPAATLSEVRHGHRHLNPRHCRLQLQRQWRPRSGRLSSSGTDSLSFVKVVMVDFCAMEIADGGRERSRREHGSTLKGQILIGGRVKILLARVNHIETTPWEE